MLIFWQTKKDYFRRFYTWVDIFFMVLSVSLSVTTITGSNKFDNTKLDSAEMRLMYEDLLKWNRYEEVLGIFLIFIKFVYFFGIVDTMAPLIDIFIRILNDIIPFVLLLGIYTLVLAVSFFHIAQN